MDALIIHHLAILVAAPLDLGEWLNPGLDKLKDMSRIVGKEKQASGCAVISGWADKPGGKGWEAIRTGYNH